ncbi:MAG: hypothetical protein ABIK30_13005 [bacterium]
MPCGDITDILTIKLDPEDRVIDYTLTKRTCGGKVGKERLIKKWLIGKDARQVAITDHVDFQAEIKVRSDLNEYIHLKHFLAVKTGLSVMFGINSGRLDDRCTVENIAYGPEGTEMTAHINVDGVVNDIKSCGPKCCKNKTTSIEVK